MTPERAAEVLRGGTMCEQDQLTALRMGADALELQAWLFDIGPNGWMRVEWLLRKWHGEDSFIDYARAEWEKERKG